MTATPSWTSEAATLYTGDATQTLAALPDASAHCIVTSPPYWGLRDYHTAGWDGGDPTCTHPVSHSAGHPVGPSTRRGTTQHPAANDPIDDLAKPADRGADPRMCRRCGATRRDDQYGLEATPDDYIATLRRVFTQLRRVLVPDGTAWLNLGDSYSTEPPGQTRRATRPSTPSGAQPAASGPEVARRSGVDRVASVPRKNLRGMPWRVALALQADGWILRNAIVWAKRNPMPESVRDRLSTTYEFVFLLTTQPRYYFDLDAIRVPLLRPEALTEGITFGGSPGIRTGALGASARRRGGTYGAKYRDPTPFTRTPPGAALHPTGRRHTATHPRGKNPGDVWSLSTRPSREAHFAAFPIDIPLRCIAAGCPPDGVVLDPFSGAATTGLAALQLGRRYVGIDLNPDYTALAQHRLQHRPQGRVTADRRPGRQPASESSSSITEASS